MRWWTTTTILGGGVMVFAACSSSSSEPTPDAGTPPVADAGETPDAETPDAAVDATTDSGAVAAGWTLHTHPCPGVNRTDALLDEGPTAMWVGCGTGNPGKGLFTSSDDGATWTQVGSDAATTLEAFRVNSIDRGPDGALFVGGTNDDDGSRARVVRIDTAASPITTTAVLTAENTVGLSFVVGSFRQRADGSALAESLNGVDALSRADADVAASAASWTKADPSVTGGVVTQILDLIVVNDAYYAAGGTIAQPPYVFVPKAAATTPYDLLAIELPRAAGAWTGEMWGVAASAEHVVAVGVNQDADTGRIYVSGPNPTVPADFVEHDLSMLYGNPTQRTWARGVCTRGERIVVVGEKQPLGRGSGLVFESTDGGETFENITPDGVSASVSKCALRDDGTLVVAGAGGLVGLYR